MSAEADRPRRVAAAALERGLDRVLVGPGANLRWLTGFTGSNGAALVDAAAERLVFVTDFRYVTQAHDQLGPEWEQRSSAQDLLGPGLEELLGPPGEEPLRIGFDDGVLTVAEHARVAAAMDGRAELVPAAGLVDALREVKNDEEIARLRAACALADAALLDVIERGLEGRTEREVAVDLEVTLLHLGADALSFPPIVASAEAGALPHAEPRPVAIERGSLVTFDWGCMLDGYCSDCTRTVAVGPPGDVEREIYEIVLRAQEAALAAVRPGVEGREVDAVARGLIAEAGHAEHFEHGTGHGVGLEVHEGPRLTRRGETRLAPGMAVTVEPGIYLPGVCGVRIEDLTVVTEDGNDVLTGLPKRLQEVE